MTINGHDDNSAVGNDGDNNIVLMEVASSDLAEVFIQPFTWGVILSSMIVGVVREPVHHDDHHLLSLV